MGKSEKDRLAAAVVDRWGTFQAALTGPTRKYPTQAFHSFADAARRYIDVTLGETNFGEPSKGDFEKMARRRFQDPKPVRQGNWWYLLYWQDEFENGRRIRKRKREKLAPATMLEREVRKIAAERLRSLNQGLLTIGSATKFEDYVEEVYRDTVLKAMAKSTQSRYNSVLKVYLLPAFGQLCLRDITQRVVQRYVSGLADSKLSQESKDKIRDVLSSVLGSAVQVRVLGEESGGGCDVAGCEEREASEALLDAGDVRGIIGADSGAVRHDGLRGGVHGSSGQRTDRASMAERESGLDHHRRTLLSR